ncbi:hypothetical protein D3C76_1674620 [compost metagenome]
MNFQRLARITDEFAESRALPDLEQAVAITPAAKRSVDLHSYSVSLLLLLLGPGTSVTPNLRKVIPESVSS